MNADEKARFDGDRINEMIAEVTRVSRDFPIMSRPRVREELRALLRSLQIGFEFIDGTKEDQR